MIATAFGKTSGKRWFRNDHLNSLDFAYGIGQSLAGRVTRITGDAGLPRVAKSLEASSKHTFDFTATVPLAVKMCLACDRAGGQKPSISWMVWSIPTRNPQTPSGIIAYSHFLPRLYEYSCRISFMVKGENISYGQRNCSAELIAENPRRRSVCRKVFADKGQMPGRKSSGWKFFGVDHWRSMCGN